MRTVINCLSFVLREYYDVFLRKTKAFLRHIASLRGEKITMIFQKRRIIELKPAGEAGIKFKQFLNKN